MSFVSLVSTLHPGDRVTISTPQGQCRSGVVRILMPAHAVLDGGGRYGTPLIANDSNILKICRSKKSGAGFVFRDKAEIPPTCPTPAEPPASTRCPEFILFRVVYVSTNTNSFGLRSAVLVDRSGEAWEVARSDYAGYDRLAQGQDIQVQRGDGSPVWASHGFELPRRLPECSAAVLAEIFK